jgi:NAD+ diphosphatase
MIRRDGDAVEAVFPRVGDVPALAAQIQAPLFLGLLHEVPYFAFELPEPVGPLAELGEFVDLRSVGALLPRDQGVLLAYARGLVHWHRTQQFCGRCGSPTLSDDGGHRRVCVSDACRTEHFPRTDPAIIVLVSYGDKALLGRQSKWMPGMYSTLAGFVEPGETMEEAVAREVKEETGVAVGLARYHSSQPWPFPASLMIGFMAEAERFSEPQVDTRELEAAAWFSRAEILAFAERGLSLPRPDSIARRLIQDWLKSHE